MDTSFPGISSSVFELNNNSIVEWKFTSGNPYGNDGDPNDCVLLTSESTTVQNVDMDIFNVVPLSAPITVSGEFYIGVNLTHVVGEYVVPLDEDTTYVYGDAYWCGTNTPGGFNPNVLSSNEYPPEDYGYYWCLRAAGIPSKSPTDLSSFGANFFEMPNITQPIESNKNLDRSDIISYCH